MKRFLAHLLIALQLFAGPAYAADRYVSNAATNGYVVGTDSGSGLTKGTAWATIAYAITNATAGDRIVVNGTSMTVAGGWFPNKTLEITPEIAYATTLTASSGNQVIVMNGVTSAVITIGEFYVDAASARLYCIYAQDNSSNPYEVVLRGTRCIGDPTTTGFRIGSALASKITFTCTDCSVTTGASATTQAGIYVLGQTGGSVTMTRPACSMAGQGTATLGCIYVNMLAANLPVTITDQATSMTLASGLTGTSSHQCLKIVNGNPVTVTGGTITCDDNGTTRYLDSVWITPHLTTPFTQVSTTTGLTINHNGALGHALLIGQDGTTAADTYHPGSTLRSITMLGGARALIANTHGFLMGASDDQIADDIYAKNFYLGGALKRSTGASKIMNSRFVDMVGYAMTARGTTGAKFVNNGYYVSGASFAASYCLYNWADIGTGTPPAASTEWHNNACRYDVAPTNGVLFSDATSDLTGSNNAISAPSYPAGMWQYAGSSYATSALWIAAGRETAIHEVNPRFVNAANDDFYARAPRLRRGGVAVAGVTTDSEGVTYLNPPSVGSRQSHVAPRRRAMGGL